MKISLIGNNLTSLILASILSDKNFHVEICYIKSSKFNFKTRSIGITEHNLIYLTNYFKNIRKIKNPINEIKVLIKNKKIDENITFNQNSKVLFNMVKYDVLKKQIENKVKSNRYISFKNLKKKSDLLSLPQKKNPDLVINCEGSNVLTEKYLRTKVFKNYNNKAFTTIISHSKIENNQAIQIFTEFGPLAFLPLSKTLTSVVFSFDMKKKDISEIEIYKIIENLNPKYKITSHLKFENFNLKLKLPKKYFFGNILFFGDSIHAIHPLAGQGFNMTLRDIINFEKIIDEKINLGLNIDKNIFSEFEKKTKSNNLLFSFGIDFIHEFFKINNNYLSKNISKKIFSYIKNNDKIKNLGILYANKGRF